MFRPEGAFEASCDFGWKAKTKARCGDRIRVEAMTGARAIKVMRSAGWTFARTTDDSLLRYSFKPIKATDDEWRSLSIRSGWGARCPLHANTRSLL